MNLCVKCKQHPVVTTVSGTDTVETIDGVFTVIHDPTPFTIIKCNCNEPVIKGPHDQYERLVDEWDYANPAPPKEVAPPDAATIKPVNR